MKTIAETIRRNLKSIRAEILRNISDIVSKQPDKYIQIYDIEDRLIVGGDEVDPINVLSLEMNEGRTIANYGRYDEDGSQDINDYGIELLCNILDACEHAEDDLKREKEIDESMNANLN